MNRSSLVDFVALVAALASVACSSSSGSSSATPAGGSGQTVGAQCHEVTLATCKRLIDVCGANVGATSNDCATQATPSCCGGSCDVTALSSPASLQVCENDINATPCPMFWDGAAVHLPASCKGVVKHPASERIDADRQSLGAVLSSASE